MDADVKQTLGEISIALEEGEYDHVERACRKALHNLESGASEVGLVNEIRTHLIQALTESHREGEPREAIADEFDRLFTGYLSAGDRASAADVLVQKMGFLRGVYGVCLPDESWPAACATAYKVIDLFGLSDDRKVMDSVEAAFGFLFEDISADDPDFIDVCVSYGKVLQRYGNPDNSSRMIEEIVYALDGVGNVTAVAILEDFLSSRLAQLSLDDETNLRERLALYTYLRSQERADDPLSLSAAGMFLHPTVDGDLDESVRIQGHEIRFATVDLSQPTTAILARLRSLVPSHSDTARDVHSNAFFR